MDDTRTQQALDQLADLFLTGQTPVAETQTPPASTPATTQSKRDNLAGPAPIRLRPKLTEKPKPAAPVAYTPPTQGDAPLRLQPQPPTSPQEEGSPIATIGDVEDHEDTHEDLVAHEESDTRDEDTAPAVAVEAVILGNLPGLSGPWLTQYAQLLAQQEGPVAILHVDDDLIDLELVEPTNRDTPSRGVSLRMPPGGGQIDPRSILEAMLNASDAADTAPQTVLIHLDPQHDEQGLARALCIDDWTLMCGADDLAIVGGYKMLKHMVESEPSVAGKKLGLMIMGSDPKESQDAARKFQSASESFLKTPVQLLGWQKQMVPVNLRHLGRFEDMGQVWPRLAEWIGQVAPAETVQDLSLVGSTTSSSEPNQSQATPEIESPAPAPGFAPGFASEFAPGVDTQPEPRKTEQVAFIPEPSKPKASELLDELAQISARPRVTTAPPAPPKLQAPAIKSRPPAPQPQPTIQPKPVVAEQPAPVAIPQPVAATPTSTAVPTAEPQPAQPAASAEPNLVELLMAGHGAVPGGIALEARCPHHNQTQLMLDQDGRLHLLCRHTSEGFDSLQAAMVDLLQARHWVHEHLELLALTQRQLKFDASTEPVLHLFTDRADWATALIARLGEALKLHLLQEVSVGQESAWFCTPLN